MYADNAAVKIVILPPPWNGDGAARWRKRIGVCSEIRVCPAVARVRAEIEPCPVVSWYLGREYWNGNGGNGYARCNVEQRQRREPRTRLPFHDAPTAHKQKLSCTVFRPFSAEHGTGRVVPARGAIRIDMMHYGHTSLFCN